MHTNRFEFAVKIVLTILSIIDGLIALIINFPGKTTVLAVIYALQQLLFGYLKVKNGLNQ